MLINETVNPDDIDINSVRLIKPSVLYMKSYIEADNENIAANIYEFPPLAYDYIKDSNSFRDYIDLLARNERGADLSEGRAPYSSFWLVDEKNKIFIGQSALRHFLNDTLRVFGGHIGYCVRPSCWGRGFGTKQLELLLPEAKKLGINNVRLTCYGENKSSARVMEKNGARIVGEVYNKIAGINKLTLIYEINLL